MSQSRSDQGQSMEDILASIRRIIAEGERDLPGFDPKRPDAGAARPAIDTRPPWSRPEPSPQATVATDVLVLTEMVQDDGSVVSLEPDKPASASAEAATTDDVPKPADQLPPAEAGAPAPGSGEPPAESHSPSAEDILQSIAAGLAVESPAGTGETAPAPVFESPPTAAVQAQAWSGDEGLSSSPVPETPTQQMEMIPVSGEGLKKPELVSEETVAASTAALAQLAQTVGRTKEASAGPSQTVDELVRGAVEPMLKQWLDANLSRIVERMVREAIEKVVRRVE